MQKRGWWLALLLFLTGCGAPADRSSTTPHGIVDTAFELKTILREQGFVVQDGEPFSDFLFERGGQLLRVNGTEVWVWEFETVEDADAARRSLDGPESPLAREEFSASPRFMQNGHMIVLFVDTNRPVLNALIAVLGNPFL